MGLAPGRSSFRRLKAGVVQGPDREIGLLVVALGEVGFRGGLVGGLVAEHHDAPQLATEAPGTQPEQTHQEGRQARAALEEPAAPVASVRGSRLQVPPGAPEQEDTEAADDKASTSREDVQLQHLLEDLLLRGHHREEPGGRDQVDLTPPEQPAEERHRAAGPGHQGQEEGRARSHLAVLREEGGKYRQGQGRHQA